MEVKNKDGSIVKLIEEKKVKLPRGKKHLLEKLTLYSPDGKHWFYDTQDIENLINNLD
jgi:hypothetical protein